MTEQFARNNKPRPRKKNQHETGPTRKFRPVALGKHFYSPGFHSHRARHRSFPFWLCDRTEGSKGRQTVSRRPGMAERAGQRGASAEDYRGGALVRARDSRSAIPLRRPNTAKDKFMGGRLV